MVDRWKRLGTGLEQQKTGIGCNKKNDIKQEEEEETPSPHRPRDETKKKKKLIKGVPQDRRRDITNLIVDGKPANN